MAYYYDNLCLDEGQANVVTVVIAFDVLLRLVSVPII